ncbi:MAG: hypothetical protein PHS59_11455 [Paludibacter sp.]|nr:hypothetical protein [Paludibacter sp.]
MNENNNIEIAEEDVKLADYIYSILKFQPTILLSWGIQRPVVIKLGLRFRVNGFSHKGIVEILYNEGADLFDVYLINEDGTLKELIEGVYFDELVDVIDQHVEWTENYNERVNKEYNITNYEEESI